MGLIFANNHAGKRCDYLEREFYVKIMRENDYSKWCAPADEVLRVIKDPEFSEEYRRCICHKIIAYEDTIKDSIGNEEGNNIVLECQRILSDSDKKAKMTALITA